LPLASGTKAYEYDVGSSLLIGGVTYTLDRVKSGFSKLETLGNSTEEVNIFSPQTIPSKLSYSPPSTTTGKAQQLAQSIDVVLGSTFVTLTMNRNLTATPASKILKIDDVSVLSCDVKYTVTRKTGGRSFGPWLELKEDGVSKSGLSRSSVGKLIGSVGSGVVDTGYGYDRIFDIIDDGCIKTCTSSMTMWLPSTAYNPDYPSPTLGPGNINSRCYGGSSGSSICTSPFIVSDYQGTDCLCGQMDLFSFSTFNNQQTGIGPLQALITLNTLNAISISNMYTNITVTSGSALGSSSVQPTTLPSLIGGVVGGILATVVTVGVFFVFSKPLGDSSKSKGASLVAKTTTPLAGVQMVIIFIAVACSISSIFSPEAFSIVSTATNGAINTFNIGLFYLLNTDGNIGTNGPAGRFAQANPPSLEPYPCAFAITGMTSSGGEDYDFQYEAGCNAARAGSVVSAVGGIAALVLCYFQRQKLAMPCIVVAAIGSFIMLGAFKVSVIDGWLSTAVPETSDTYFGSGFSIMVVAVFFYIVAIFAWVIDSLSMEEA